MQYFFTNSFPKKSTRADYDSVYKKISIRSGLGHFSTPQERLDFCITFAHELCHANQKEERISEFDLSARSIGDTFHVSRMAEVEARLLQANVENELLKRREFQDCKPSALCQFYRKLLEENDGDISQANTNFVLSLWQNISFLIQETDLNTQYFINHHYMYYSEVAYCVSRYIHDPVRKTVFSTNESHPLGTKRHPLEAMFLYVKRMSLTGVSPKSFLQNGFDDIQITDNIKDGITFTKKGHKFLNISPIDDNLLVTKHTYFSNGQPTKVILKNVRTGEETPLDDKHDQTEVLNSSKSSPLSTIQGCPGSIRESHKGSGEKLSASVETMYKAQIGRHQH